MRNQYGLRSLLVIFLVKCAFIIVPSNDANAAGLWCQEGVGVSVYSEGLGQEHPMEKDLLRQCYDMVRDEHMFNSHAHKCQGKFNGENGYAKGVCNIRMATGNLASITYEIVCCPYGDDEYISDTFSME